MNKKIAVISYHTCPLSDEDVTQTGGLNIYVLELSKALAQKGYSLDIYTRQVDKDSPTIVNVLPNLRVIHLPAGPVAYTPKKQLIKHIPEFIINLFKFIETGKLNYGLVYCHYYMSGLAGIEIKKKLNIPLIINFHTLALMKNLVARYKEETEDVERIQAEMLLLKKADKIIATSNIDAKYISALYDYPFEKVQVLTPGVNPDLFKPMDQLTAKNMIGAEKNHKIILFVGRIEPLKGIDVLLYAFKILIEKVQGMKICLFIIGGETKESMRLKVIKDLLKIKAYVRFIGKKTQAELPFYYNASEIVVMPSQYESFGIAALEAMACGTPVITTDVTGISSLFDENHHPLITSASNPILLAEKIENLLTNKEEYDKLKNEVFQKGKKLSWEKIAEEFTKIIENS